MKRLNLVGQKFGHLTVTEMLYGYGKSGETYCKCLCECGNECIKASYELRHHRNPPHCGCMTQYYKRIQSHNGRIDLVGKRFGSLVVTEMIYKDNAPTFVKCKCDCGNTIIRRATYLTGGDTTSCGCVQKERAREANEKDFTGVTSNYGVTFLYKDSKNAKGQCLWKCRCACGKEFVALPAKILNGHTTSCGCQKRSSKERLIYNILSNENIPFKQEYRFADCKDIQPLRFDFYIPSRNTVIEYQGKQHYLPIKLFGGESEYNKRKFHDDLKKEYCKKNNIRLVELPYTLSDKEIYQKIVNIIYP